MHINPAQCVSSMLREVFYHKRNYISFGVHDILPPSKLQNFRGQRAIVAFADTEAPL